jgi:hypothetical protein
MDIDRAIFHGSFDDFVRLKWSFAQARGIGPGTLPSA